MGLFHYYTWTKGISCTGVINFLGRSKYDFIQIKVFLSCIHTKNMSITTSHLIIEQLFSKLG